MGRVLPDGGTLAPARRAGRARRRCRITASCGARPGPARSTSTRTAPRSPGTARGERLPYEFQREVTLDRAGSRWSASAIGCGTRVATSVPLDLVGASAVQRAAGHHARAAGRAPGEARRGAWAADLSRDDVVSWPEAIGGEPDRFTFPGGGRLGGQAVRRRLGRRGRMTLTDPRAGRAARDPGATPRRCRRWASGSTAADGRRRDGRRTTTWRWSRASARRTGWRMRCCLGNGADAGAGGGAGVGGGGEAAGSTVTGAPERARD